MDRYIVTLKDEIKGLSELEAGYVIGRMVARIDNLRDEYIHVCKEREEANKRHEAEIKKLKWACMEILWVDGFLDFEKEALQSGGITEDEIKAFEESKRKAKKVEN